MTFITCCCLQICRILTFTISAVCSSVVITSFICKPPFPLSLSSILHFCNDPVSPRGLLKFHFIIYSNLKYSAFVWPSHLSALHEHSLRLQSAAACRQHAIMCGRNDEMGHRSRRGGAGDQYLDYV